jgi:predicted Zn-dependent protease
MKLFKTLQKLTGTAPKKGKPKPAKRAKIPKTKTPASKTPKKTPNPKRTTTPKKTPMKRLVKAKRAVSKTVKKPVKQKAAKTVKAVKPAKKKMPVKKKTAEKGLTKHAKKRTQPAKSAVVEFVTAMEKEMAVERKILRQYPVLEGADSPRITMVTQILKDITKKGIISDWSIGFGHNRSSNLYVERNFTIEDDLSSIRENLLVTIYERADGMIGEAQLAIVTDDAAEARDLIMAAKLACQHTRKKAFDLPHPDDIAFPESHDESLFRLVFSGEGSRVTHTILEQARAVLTPLEVKTNGMEVLTSAGTVRIMNSNGVDVSYHRSEVYVEFVLSTKAKEEREFTISKRVVSPEQLDLPGMILQQVQIVRDAASAAPNPGFEGDVLFAGPSVTEFFTPHHDFNPLVTHTFAKLQHMGLNLFTKGQPLGPIAGEPITITSNPALPLGLATAPVDEEGTPLRAVELIRNSVFINHIATSRYAQYLGVPATGMVSNLQVSPGATREQHLRGNNYLEIVSFSWFNPNPFSGEVSAEIRLAYHWVNGKKTPYRGGTFTGNVFKNILNARFSKEIIQSGSYYGPRTILFRAAKVHPSE